MLHSWVWDFVGANFKCFKGEILRVPILKCSRLALRFNGPFHVQQILRDFMAARRNVPHLTIRFYDAYFKIKCCRTVAKIWWVVISKVSQLALRVYGCSIQTFYGCLFPMFNGWLYILLVWILHVSWLTLMFSDTYSQFFVTATEIVFDMACSEISWASILNVLQLTYIYGWFFQMLQNWLGEFMAAYLKCFMTVF